MGIRGVQVIAWRQQKQKNLAQIPVAADEPCEAAFGLVRHCDVAVVKPDTTVVQVKSGLRFYGRFATERSLARLVSDYKDRRTSPLYSIPTRLRPFFLAR